MTQPLPKQAKSFVYTSVLVAKIVQKKSVSKLLILFRPNYPPPLPQPIYHTGTPRKEKNVHYRTNFKEFRSFTTVERFQNF